MTISTARVPEAMEPLFERAEEYVRRYFDTRKESPQEGVIVIGGERYILVRAASMSVSFFEHIKALYPGLNESEASKVTGSVLFDIAHALGVSDARAFHETLKVTDPIEKLSTGPIHFSHTGWAFVDILKESRPSPDVNYYLIYDHPQSFEADSWIVKKKKADFPVCSMNAGYSTGWCQASFGVELATREILCRAKGDKYCRFIMGHPSKIEGYVEKYKGENPELFGR
jgi:predicted hydrocarbon binding protein